MAAEDTSSASGFSRRRFVGGTLSIGLSAAATGPLSAMASPAGPAPAHPNDKKAPLFDPDYGRLIGRSDLTYTGRITTGTQGMSVANGRFGGPVWQSNGSTLVMQLNHTDMFMFNDASAASA